MVQIALIFDLLLYAVLILDESLKGCAIFDLRHFVLKYPDKIFLKAPVLSFPVQRLQVRAGASHGSEKWAEIIRAEETRGLIRETEEHL